MDFRHTNIEGAYAISINKREDERGFFARLFCQDEFKAAGIASDVVQANLSHNAYSGTVRGMHYQIEPAPETKLIRCIRGSIHDVIVDLRPHSPSFKQQLSITLTEDNNIALFVPALCAHGFQTLEDRTDVLYMVSGQYQPEYERGLRHDDPALHLKWPLPVNHISAKDTLWPLLSDTATTND